MNTDDTDNDRTLSSIHNDWLDGLDNKDWERRALLSMKDFASRHYGISGNEEGSLLVWETEEQS